MCISPQAVPPATPPHYILASTKSERLFIFLDPLQYFGHKVIMNERSF